MRFAKSVWLSKINIITVCAVINHWHQHFLNEDGCLPNIVCYNAIYYYGKEFDHVDDQLIPWATVHYHSLSWFCFSFPHTRWGEGKQQSVQASLHASHSSVVSGHLTFTTSVVLPHANVLPVCSYQWHWEEENKNRKGNKVKLDTLMTVNKVFSSGVRRRIFFWRLNQLSGKLWLFCALWSCLYSFFGDWQPVIIPFWTLQQKAPLSGKLPSLYLLWADQ